MVHSPYMQYSAVFRMVKQCKSALTSPKLVSAYFDVSWCLLCMGGRGSGVCVNICVPSSTLEKPNVVFNSKQWLSGLRKKVVDK